MVTKALRLSFSCLVVLVTIIVGFWIYHRNMVENFARTSVAQVFHIPQNEIDIERVQELVLGGIN